ncbi:MAG: carbamoyltransferase [Cyanobacteria bacterium P01_F01_bin.143]
MKILGISAFYHDSAAALIDQGVILAAAQEERFTRKKHFAGFPQQAIQFCLKHCQDPTEIDAVVFYEKPFRKFNRLLQMHLSVAPHGIESFVASIPLWLRKKLFQGTEVARRVKNCFPEANWQGELLFTEHHQAHAASAFYPSPFQDAVVLTMDGVGEWATTSCALGNGNQLKPKKQISFPHSIGLLYSAFTAYLGFRINSGEYKVMGLAPYGQPKYKELILSKLVDLKEDGSFRLNQRFFNYCNGLSMTNDAFDELFDGKPRKSESQLTQREMDIAASIQAVTEEIVLRIARHLSKEYSSENLCLAGGVALNCVANGKILREKIFKQVWVQPAAGDAGGALGAALAAYYQHYGHQRELKSSTSSDSMQGCYLGPSFSSHEAKQRLVNVGAKLRYVASEKILLKEVAQKLANGLAVGWFQGSMEYGPRALGARSILASPTLQEMQTVLNLKIKFRESFRPFAPAILAEYASEWFEIDRDSPYMLFVTKVNHSKLLTGQDISATGLEKLKVQRSVIPAVTHVDNTARIQTVHRKTNPKFHQLLSYFFEETGCPILINTSFNIRGEPIVCTPEDAFRCFMGTNLDLLVVEDCIMDKSDQEQKLMISYQDSFELD